MWLPSIRLVSVADERSLRRRVYTRSELRETLDIHPTEIRIAHHKSVRAAKASLPSRRAHRSTALADKSTLGGSPLVSGSS